MGNTKHLLILGGGLLNMKSVEEVKANGFHVYVADGNEKAPCFSIADVPIHVDITDPQKVYEAIKEFPISGIVSAAEAGVYTGAWLNDKLNLKGITPETALLATSKAGMRKSWADIPYSVNFRIVSSFSEAQMAVKELNTLPLIIKPDKTYGGSRGVSKINDEKELLSAFEYAKTSGQNEFVVIEECAVGEEYSCEAIIIDGRSHVLCIGSKVKSPMPYRVDCSVNYPARVDEALKLQIEDMVQLATSKIGHNNGVAHVEFAVTEAGPRLFELGARCGGGHTPLIAKHVSGVSEFLEYAKIACGEQVNFKILDKMRGAIYRFIIFDEGEVSAVSINESLKSNKEIYDLVLDVKKGDIIKELKSTSQRSGACIILSDTFNHAEKIADQVCSDICITYTDGSIKPAKIFNS